METIYLNKALGFMRKASAVLHKADDMTPVFIGDEIEHFIECLKEYVQEQEDEEMVTIQ